MTDRDAVPTDPTPTPITTEKTKGPDERPPHSHWLDLLTALSGDLTRHTRALSRELMFLRDEGIHPQAVDDCLEMATRLRRTCRDLDRLGQVAHESPSANVNGIAYRFSSR